MMQVHSLWTCISVESAGGPEPPNSGSGRSLLSETIHSASGPYNTTPTHFAPAESADSSAQPGQQATAHADRSYGALLYGTELDRQREGQVLHIVGPGGSGKMPGEGPQRQLHHPGRDTHICPAV